ncbi:bifunctional diaminohydroxyphosphoribosylaminopyrimidine deaminase/5-amino-6-(5-phosphoribosylamino)uracil reductase RibD [Flavobacteriaceae bacterium AH-315-B10]|nr:bifunctional diaminohydroxyphosphoribosylaminopyrimidine deaminase/5-amino-6-(5-phosphoribosylamino)uracil reductase RibD [Flavobacteriaceae bacterium AH-315-B10]
MKIHEKYINRCIEIAKNGLGSTRPNPMVGCVIVHENTIIGEGYTSDYGGNHAEVNAIESVKDKALLKKATLYVTLEPCYHFGKTPPCSDLIVEHKIPNVVIGTIDTNSKVAGQGIVQLKAAECNVTVGVLEDECKQHHKRFFTFHNKKRPYVILKWAETTDGFIAPSAKKENAPIWITNEYSKQLVHKWRAEEQAILIGTNTVLQDNPSLTTRHWKGNNPIRIVIDRAQKLSKDCTVFNMDVETIIISEKVEVGKQKRENIRLKNQNLNLEFINWDLKDKIALQICDILYSKNINSVIIEGGQQTLQTFINENIWDEARVFIGNKTFNNGVEAPKLKGRLISEEQIIDDVLKIFINN